MADREFVFGHPAVQKILREKFILVAADDWYQRRQKDPVGVFFRAVADQGPRKGAAQGTSQGRYTFTASGKLLGFNNNRDPRRIIAMLEDSVRRYEALPAAERRPGEISVPALARGERDPRYTRSVEDDTVPVKVHSRVLRKEGESYVACGGPETGTAGFRHQGFGVATDHLWIKEAELAQLTSPAPPENGRKIPAPLAMRLARFHLVDNTRGEPPHWRRNEVREIEIYISPGPGQGIQPCQKSYRIQGRFHLETADGGRGFEGEMDGVIRTRTKDQKLNLHLVAVGNHWGEGPYTRGARPGRNPLAIVFTPGDRNDVRDRVPPQAARWEQGYWEADRH